jgi:hypothetical protein
MGLYNNFKEMKYMKKIAIAMVMTVLLTISFSCSEDFLDKAPMGVTSENVFYNAKGIDALLTGNLFNDKRKCIVDS